MTSKELAWKIFESWYDEDCDDPRIHVQNMTFEITRSEYGIAYNYIYEKSVQLQITIWNIDAVLNELVEICCAFRHWENWVRNFHPCRDMVPGIITPDNKWVLYETEG